MLDIAETQDEGAANRARLDVATGNGGVLIAATGPWTVRNFGPIHKAVTGLSFPRRKRPQAAQIDLNGLTELDTAGAWLLNHLHKRLAEQGIGVFVSGGTPAQLGLLRVVDANSGGARPQKPPRRTMPLIGDMAGALAGAAGDLVRLTAFLGAVVQAALRTSMRPWRFRWVSFVHHIDHTGLRAVPIVSLICLLIGGVVTQQGILQLQLFGAEPYAVDMVGILALREVGILLTAIIVAGRSASAFTAEIGTMKTREEIDAMRTLGIDPLETLVLPRMAALILTLPILAFIGDIACLVGGGVMSYAYLDISVSAYIDRLHDAVSLRHFMVGIVKAPLAAVIIGLVGCLEGLSVRGSAESLGVHVTAAVVKAIFLVIIFDALFAMFLSASGF